MRLNYRWLNDISCNCFNIRNVAEYRRVKNIYSTGVPLSEICMSQTMGVDDTHTHKRDKYTTDSV